jgi:hypothetical protein
MPLVLAGCQQVKGSLSFCGCRSHAGLFFLFYFYFMFVRFAYFYCIFILSGCPPELE